MFPTGPGANSRLSAAARRRGRSVSPTLGQTAGLPHVKLSAVGAQRDDRSQRMPDRLVVRTVPVDDPGDLVARLPHPRSVAWIRRGEGLAGWGEAARVSIPAGEDRFTAGEKWLIELFDGAEVTDEVGLPGCGPVAFGSFTFDPTSDGSVLVVPAAVLGRSAGRSWLTTVGDGHASQEPVRPT